MINGMQFNLSYVALQIYVPSLGNAEVSFGRVLTSTTSQQRHLCREQTLAEAVCSHLILILSSSKPHCLL